MMMPQQGMSQQQQQQQVLLLLLLLKMVRCGNTFIGSDFNFLRPCVTPTSIPSVQPPIFETLLFQSNPVANIHRLLLPPVVPAAASIIPTIPPSSPSPLFSNFVVVSNDDDDNTTTTTTEGDLTRLWTQQRDEYLAFSKDMNHTNCHLYQEYAHYFQKNNSTHIINGGSMSASPYAYQTSGGIYGRPNDRDVLIKWSSMSWCRVNMLTTTTTPSNNTNKKKNDIPPPPVLVVQIRFIHKVPVPCMCWVMVVRF